MRERNGENVCSENVNLANVILFTKACRLTQAGFVDSGWSQSSTHGRCSGRVHDLSRTKMSTCVCHFAPSSPAPPSGKGDCILPADGFPILFQKVAFRCTRRRGPPLTLPQELRGCGSSGSLEKPLCFSALKLRLVTGAARTGCGER